MGLGASHSEGASAVFQNQPSIHHDSFIHFVFDNADFNVGTLAGYGTLHSLWGVSGAAHLEVRWRGHSST